MTTRTVLAAFLLTLLFGTALAADDKAAKSNEETAAAVNDPTASEILAECSRIIPTEKLLLTGRIKVRKLRGIVLQENPFKLMTDWGANPPSAEILLLDLKGTSLVERAILSRPTGQPAQIRVFSGDDQKPVETPSYAGRVIGSDMTWLDLSMDYLWWQSVHFDDPKRGKSRNGRDCDILIAVPPHPIPGCVALRIWVDRQLKCLMQVEQIGLQGEPVRRMWVQRVKKMKDRWMIRDMEVETFGSGHRTQLLIEELAEP
ncbi:MAG: outer membrane lipoprotein-sorting protein [Kiritimatiellae bacterium]|nr:outer membrane lipoprotein-sorting protein [Kiritimatiellia bacterium]